MRRRKARHTIHSMEPASESPAPLITWVNHASFLIRHGAVALLCDPWFSGTAFNDGWELLSPTQLPYEAFSDVTHLWISHQHPDHFAPGTLRRIPEEARKRITTFYQHTDDKLVVSWLRGAGFAHVEELSPGGWLSVGADMAIKCGTVTDDSWLAIKCAGRTFLNLNDCVIKRPGTIASIAAEVGSVDVLFTQFSYAQWEGNPEESRFRREQALEKFDRIRLQDEYLHPSTIVPFASFVYYCHEENFYLNDCMNAVGDVAEFIERDLGKRAVVLYPGESWIAGETRDWRTSAARYATDTTRRLAAGPTRFIRPARREERLSCANGFLRRLTAKNPRARLLVRDRATVFLTDIDEAFEFSVDGMRNVARTREDVDVVTSAENIIYAFRMPWGGNTLNVSGRFLSPRHSHSKLFRLLRELHRYNVMPVDGAWALSEGRRLLRGFRNCAARLVRR